jgi:hypothetical protein
VYKRGKDTELGAYHGIDLPFWFNGNAGEPTTGVDALSEFAFHSMIETQLKIGTQSISSTPWIPIAHLRV